MKRLIFYVSLLFLLISICFSQQKKFEGYDKLPWGTSLEEFKRQNPDAYEQTSAEDKNLNQKKFRKDINSAIRIYCFFDNKLCWGRTAYIDPSIATLKAVTEKLQNEYGYSYDLKKGKDKNSDYYHLIWNVSPNLTITLEFREIYNSLGRISATVLFINYQNDKITSKIEDYEKKQKMKDLEL